MKTPSSIPVFRTAMAASMVLAIALAAWTTRPITAEQWRLAVSHVLASSQEAFGADDSTRAVMQPRAGEAASIATVLRDPDAAAAIAAITAHVKLGALLFGLTITTAALVMVLWRIIAHAAAMTSRLDAVENAASALSADLGDRCDRLTERINRLVAATTQLQERIDAIEPPADAQRSSTDDGDTPADGSMWTRRDRPIDFGFER